LLRTLVLLLLAANLAFAAWTQGLLAPLAMPPMSSEREPERLRSQVRPETVTVLDARTSARLLREQALAGSAAAASAASASAPADTRARR
jgi:hypothetical protein